MEIAIRTTTKLINELNNSLNPRDGKSTNGYVPKNLVQKITMNIIITMISYIKLEQVTIAQKVSSVCRLHQNTVEENYFKKELLCQSI